MHHFVINLIKITAHQMQDFQLHKHQKTFGSRALPRPAGELKRSPRPPSRKTGAYFYGEEEGRGGEREGGEGRERPPRVGGHPHFQILKNTLVYMGAPHCKAILGQKF